MAAATGLTPLEVRNLWFLPNQMIWTSNGVDKIFKMYYYKTMIPFFTTIFRFIQTVARILKDPEYKWLLIFVAVILIIGTIFYNHVEGFSILDSIYFSVTTLMTIGYGDFVPKTAAGKIFTIIYLFIGVGIIFGFITAVAHHANPRSRAKKRKKEKERELFIKYVPPEIQKKQKTKK